MAKGFLVFLIWIQYYYYFQTLMAQILSCTENFLPIAGVSQTKVQEVYQSVQIYPCEGRKGQPATLRPHVINAPLNLIGRDLLMQWHTQIYIPHFS